MSVHNVFITYHHKNDQYYKNHLASVNTLYPVFNDMSVDTGDISDDLGDQVIRQKIRDEYLRESTVTIVLVGTETKYRKHVDWEIYSSMIDGSVNKKSGILVVNLPSTNSTYYTASHDGEKQEIYPEHTSWMSINSRDEYEKRYPYMPDRIIDNLLDSKAKISITNWNKIENNLENLKFLIEATCKDRVNCEYDLSRKMRRANYNPTNIQSLLSSSQFSDFLRN